MNKEQLPITMRAEPQSDFNLGTHSEARELLRRADGTVTEVTVFVATDRNSEVASYYEQPIMKGGE